ncbi:hypothetical protein Belba_0570 [Belliella baltica DSM 15883]|uniref:Uncharacterized protein n=1 Tax=Belliella baltica (strain DSM 15883 / CIP 108006 / LMG 21964 / BA134) TaxID=866536 RepID=I3Z1V9_BELBD|nr:hypothetical protein [Belliella baltica]AFL83227.1 hypothetical protein Belba_0570 [Belliella baltica DSM 15883]
MSVKINSKYLENYAIEFSKKVCDQYFSSKKYMTGTEILNLTPSKQVNFFIIKSLFEAWHAELEKLKSNPYFDYRDNNVHRALNEFMNVLSRSIKIGRENFEPLLTEAVAFSILVALEPLSFFRNEFEKSAEGKINDFLKENKKYYKWHLSLIENLIDRAGISQTKEAYLSALTQNFDQQKDHLKTAEELLSELKETLYLDFDILYEFVAEDRAQSVDSKVGVEEQEKTIEKPEVPENEDSSNPEKEIEFVEKVEVAEKVYKVADSDRAIDPLQAWAKFESEQYSVMKSTIGELSESIGINQRFMFTKELFDGNPDLMKHALKSIDQCDSFMEAISLVNERYVGELNWDKNSEPVEEFLQLIFRKFDQKG